MRIRSRVGPGWWETFLCGGVGGVLSLCAQDGAAPAKITSVPAPPAMTVTNRAALTNSGTDSERVEEAPAPADPSQDSPYQAIMGRNAFGLRPIPPAPTNELPAASVIPTALKLTGLTTMLGTRAMFCVQEPGKKETYSDLLREGDRDGSITNLEVIQINANAGEVKVVYGGKELTLNFAQNGIQPPVGPASGAVVGQGGPGAPSVQGRPSGVGGPVQPVAAVTTAQFGGGTQPTFPPGISGGSAVNSSGASGLRSIPTRPTRLGGNSLGTTGSSLSTVPVTQPAFQGTPEQQLQTIVDQSTRLEQSGIPMPPVPGVVGGNVDQTIPLTPPPLPQ